MREKSFASQLARVIGLQFLTDVGSRPGFVRSVSEVMDQDVGGDAPAKSELKTSNNGSVKSGRYFL
jgi:hypothetical protein